MGTVASFQHPGTAGLGADYVATLRGTLVQLDDGDYDLLHQACRDHTSGLVDGDITVQVCWDADRLDLGRVGITPNPRRLCTDFARLPETIAWAEGRARQRTVPALVQEEWGIKL